jgi:D-arginine utilization repressor
VATSQSQGKHRKASSTAPGVTVNATGMKLDLLAELLPQLARAVGPLYELVLHEKKGKKVRIKAISNNHISNRTTGGPMARIFYEGKEISEPQEALYNYPGITEDRKRLRCSSIPIRHEDDVIGYLCVNFLIHDLQSASDVLAGLLATEVDAQQVREFVPKSADIFDSIVEKAIRERGRPAESLTRPEKLELMRTLRARGALNVRGAIRRIAARLGLSRTAVYNYLRQS